MIGHRLDKPADHHRNLNMVHRSTILNNRSRFLQRIGTRVCIILTLLLAGWFQVFPAQALGSNLPAHAIPPQLTLTPAPPRLPAKAYVVPLPRVIPMPTPTPYPSDHYELVVIPDTQGEDSAIFQSQVGWILNNHVTRNIVFMLHEGDIVGEYTTAEWNKAFYAYSRLNGIVPYALAVGNHDYDEPVAGRDLLKFNDRFTQSLFAQYPSFGGTYKPNHMENSYFLFSAGGQDFLILVLEFGPRTSVVAWANTIVKQYPNRRVILLTHCYMAKGTSREGPGMQLNPYNWFKSADVLDGAGLWNKLVKPNANFSLVLSGHIPAVGRRMDLGAHGNQVYQMLANYQNTHEGGDGFFRILDFYPSQHKFTVSTYSPYINQWKTDPDNQFEYNNVDFLR
jgi:Calcineurin-like phosphoesterase